MKRGADVFQGSGSLQAGIDDGYRAFAQGIEVYRDEIGKPRNRNGNGGDILTFRKWFN